MLLNAKPNVKNENKQPKEEKSFRDGYPADIWPSFGWTSWVKNFGQALENLENKHLGADIHDPNPPRSMTPIFRFLQL